MQFSTLANMIRIGADDFDCLYTLEKLVSANFGWKIVYNVNEKYFVEDIIAYAFIKKGTYYELIPITPQELHLPQSLPEFVLKNDYIGLITPENEFVANENILEDTEHINIQAIKKALKKNRINLNQL